MTNCLGKKGNLSHFIKWKGLPLHNLIFTHFLFKQHHDVWFPFSEFLWTPWLWLRNRPLTPSRRSVLLRASRRWTTGSRGRSSARPCGRHGNSSRPWSTKCRTISLSTLSRRTTVVRLGCISWAFRRGRGKTLSSILTSSVTSSHFVTRIHGDWCWTRSSRS